MALTATGLIFSSPQTPTRSHFEEEDELEHEPLDPTDSFDTDSLDIDRPSSNYDSLQADTLCPLPLAELTTDNLLTHTQLFDPGAAIIMQAPTTPSASSKSAADSAEALAKYGLQIEPDIPYPQDLEQHLNLYIRIDRHVPPSPAAAKLNTLAKVLKRTNEATIVSLIAELITFNGKLNDTLQGEHHIRRDMNVSFKKALVNNGQRQLTQPQPDRCIGYILSQDAASFTTALFSKEQEDVLLDYGPSVQRETLWPIVTCQVKTGRADFQKASDQTARDAMALDRAKRDLLAAARLTVTAVDTLHWSVTCKGEVLTLFIHWSVMRPDGQIVYYMKEFFKTLIGTTTQVLPQVRVYSRNILDFALHQRVERLKFIVPRILNLNADSGYAGSVNEFASPPFTPIRQAQPGPSIFSPHSPSVMPMTAFRQGPPVTPAHHPHGSFMSFQRAPEASPTRIPNHQRSDRPQDGTDRFPRGGSHGRPWDV